MNKYLLPIVFCLIFVFSCKKSIEVETDYNNLMGKWYFHYYPFYQECDKTSWVSLEDNGYCETQIVCNPPGDVVAGTWYHENDNLYLDCPLLEGLNKDAKITYLSADTLKIEAYYGSVRLPIGVTFARNPKK